MRIDRIDSSIEGASEESLVQFAEYPKSGTEGLLMVRTGLEHFVRLRTYR